MKQQPTAAEESPLPGGKEKRKRKLDEIVLGLSAAKTEHKTFPDPFTSPSSKKTQIPPSVSVTPASGPMSSNNQTPPASQKPFSVTVTSVPGSNTNKSNLLKFSRFEATVFIQNIIHELFLIHLFFALGSSKNATNQGNSGLTALQNMAMIGTGSTPSSSRGGSSSSHGAQGAQGAQGLSAKEIYAQSQQFFKEQQKLVQQLPPNSAQRKAYESILNEMKQAAEQR